MIALEAQRLLPHSAAAHPAISIEVSIRQFGEWLELDFALSGKVEVIVMPKPESYKPEKGNRLWEHTCFEAFVRPDGSDSYFEANASPARLWAMYEFDSYRAGMREVFPAIPRIFFSKGGDFGLILSFCFPRNGPSRLGLSAVIEAVDGTKSYWALRHPPGPPDFHHPDCFALTLPAPD